MIKNNFCQTYNLIITICLVLYIIMSISQPTINNCDILSCDPFDLYKFLLSNGMSFYDFADYFRQKAKNICKIKKIEFIDLDTDKFKSQLKDYCALKEYRVNRKDVKIVYFE
jgi:hypothetical protein